MTVFLSIPDTCPTSFQTLDSLHPVYRFFVEYSAVFAITFAGQQTHTTTGAACEQAVAKADPHRVSTHRHCWSIWQRGAGRQRKWNSLQHWTKNSNDWKSRSTRTGGIFIDMVTKYQNYVKNKVLSKAALYCQSNPFYVLHYTIFHKKSAASWDDQLQETAFFPQLVGWEK